MRQTLILLAVAAATSSHCVGQPCEPRWQNGFTRGGPLSNVHAQAVFDAGTGPMLYIGDDRGVWQWDGVAWLLIGEMVAQFEQGARAMIVYDDGSGPALYAGGDFLSVNGIPGTERLARWDGTQWTPMNAALGHNGFSFPQEFVRSLAVHDDGGGPALFIGGGFDKRGTTTLNRIAKWDGSTWSALADGFAGETQSERSVRAMVTYGGDLYATGGFRTAGTTAVDGIARWDGATWHPVQGGLGHGFGLAMTVHDVGQGPQLYVGGAFHSAGTLGVNSLVRWNGSVWSRLDQAPNSDPGGTVMALHSHPGGPLYIGGTIQNAGGLQNVNNIVAYHGSGWSRLSTGVGGVWGTLEPVRSIITHDDGSGPHVFMGGSFSIIGGIGVQHAARWTGNGWAPIDVPRHGAASHSGKVWTLRDAAGEALYIANVDALGGIFAKGAALRWDGYAWTILGGMPHNPALIDMASFDDGNGPAIYAAWYNNQEPGLITRWTGSQWLTIATLTSGVGNGSASALAVYDDGSGPHLYAGGVFDAVNGVPVNRVARWDGSSWQPVGDGLSGQYQGSGPSVVDMQVHDDALYVAGNFSNAGSTPVDRVAKWTGTWSSVGGPSLYSVKRMLVAETPAGRKLLSQTNAFNAAIFRLEAGVWIPHTTPSPAGFGNVNEFDLGDGPMLYTAHSSVSSATGLFRWNNSAWEELPGQGPVDVRSMAAFDPDGPTGPQPSSLWMVGRFSTAGGIESYQIARLNGCAGACYANCDGSMTTPVLNVDDFTCFINAFAAAASLPHTQQVEHSANCDGSTVAPVLNVDDFTCFINAFAAGCP